MIDQVRALQAQSAAPRFRHACRGRNGRVDVTRSVRTKSASRTDFPPGWRFTGSGPLTAQAMVLGELRYIPAAAGARGAVLHTGNPCTLMPATQRSRTTGCHR